GRSSPGGGEPLQQRRAYRQGRCELSLWLEWPNQQVLTASRTPRGRRYGLQRIGNARASRGRFAVRRGRGGGGFEAAHALQKNFHTVVKLSTRVDIMSPPV